MPSKYPQQGIAPSIISQPKAELILKSYGLSALRKNLYSKFNEEEEDTTEFNSRLGNPVFDNIILLSPRHVVKTPKEDFQFLDSFGNPNASDSLVKTTLITPAGNIRVPEEGTQESTNTSDNGSGFNALRIDTVLIELTQIKNVVATAVAGANGTIKEYIGDGDYQIKIRGFIESGGMNKYPKTDVGILSLYLQAPVPIKIISDYLRTFNIDKIVVLDYNFPQTEGRRNLQFFEINAISDKELEAGFIKKS